MSRDSFERREHLPRLRPEQLTAINERLSVRTLGVDLIERAMDRQSATQSGFVPEHHRRINDSIFRQQQPVYETPVTPQSAPGHQDTTPPIAPTPPVAAAPTPIERPLSMQPGAEQIIHTDPNALDLEIARERVLRSVA